MNYTVKTLQLTDPEKPFYAVVDPTGKEHSWHTTQEEAIEWINSNG